MQRYELINLIARQIRARSYLEIGVQRGVCFSQIEVPYKVGVDPDPTSAATVKMTSDMFFLSNQERFDLVFIDGLHLNEQVRMDILNTTSVLNPGGVVVIHDCDPPNERAGGREMCGGVWCGDVWWEWSRFRQDSTGMSFTVDTDLGCGVIYPRRESMVPLAFPGKAPVDWQDFQAHRAEWLGLVTVEQARRIIATMEPVDG